MNWTKKIPQKDGLYWFRGEIKDCHDDIETVETTIVKISTWWNKFKLESQVYFIGTDIGIDISKLEGEWYGPLEIPE